MMEGIPDKTLLAIATAIGNNEKLLALTLELQFSYAEFSNFKATNHSGGEVTASGTTSMLFTWRERQRPKDQARVLFNALEKVGLLEVADIHLSQLLELDRAVNPSGHAAEGNITTNQAAQTDAVNRGRGTRISLNVRQEQLSKISRDFPHANFEAFSLQLGMGSNQANNILIKNCKDYRMAIMEVLMAWKNRTGGPCSELEDALSTTGAGDLIEKVLYK